jgi:hypothetical protein
LKDDLEQSMQRELLLIDELRQSEGTHIVTNYQSRSRVELELHAKTMLVDQQQEQIRIIESQNRDLDYNS